MSAAAPCAQKPWPCSAPCRRRLEGSLAHENCTGLHFHTQRKGLPEKKAYCPFKRWKASHPVISASFPPLGMMHVVAVPKLFQKLAAGDLGAELFTELSEPLANAPAIQLVFDDRVAAEACRSLYAALNARFVISIARKGVNPILAPARMPLFAIASFTASCSLPRRRSRITS